MQFNFDVRMLEKLYIRNYALIAEQEIEFSANLNVITGETGAGKSILLGALGLILGNRSNLKLFKDSGKKCVVEGVFDIANLQLQSFFEEHDLDFDAECIVRREISASGKSRAFVNDTPVSLNVLKALTNQLVNLTAQHENLLLFDKRFQLNLLDELGGNADNLTSYKSVFTDFKKTEQELAELKENLAKQKAELDYINFQLVELGKAELGDPNEQQIIEEELGRLNNVEAIKQVLTESSQLLVDGDYNVLQLLTEAKNAFDKIADFKPEYAKLCERLGSAYYELQDLQDEIATNLEMVEDNPERAFELQERLDTFIRLQNKHSVSDLQGLINLQEALSVQKDGIRRGDNRIEALEKKLVALKQSMFKKAELISKNRKKIAPKIEKNTKSYLSEMGMGNAELSIQFSDLEVCGNTGIDDVEWLFTANKGSQAVELKKVASGGELSRLMLSLQSIIAHSVAMPTLIFDEIDTGISGEVSKKVGRVLKRLAQQHQIICITHLPQIASCANHHFYVYKDDETGITQTSVKVLNNEEHIYEIGQMLDGKPPGQAALDNARNLVGEMRG